MGLNECTNSRIFWAYQSIVRNMAAYLHTSILQYLHTGMYRIKFFIRKPSEKFKESFY